MRTTSCLIAALLVALVACVEQDPVPAAAPVGPEPTATYTALVVPDPTPADRTPATQTPIPPATPASSSEPTQKAIVSPAEEKQQDCATPEPLPESQAVYRGGQSGGVSLRTMEERIIDSDLIAIARMTNVICAVETVDYGSRSGYVGALKFTFRIREVLKSPEGSSPTQVIGMVSSTYPLETRAQAGVVAHKMFSERDTQWDDRAAIIFLASSTTDYPATAAEDVYFMSFIDYFTGIGDSYSIASRDLRLWLPEANLGTDNYENPRSTSPANRRFLTGVSQQTSAQARAAQARAARSPGFPTPPKSPSVALSDLRSDISRLVKEQRADSYIGYQYCVSAKYRRKRRDIEFADRGGPDPVYTFTQEISSGVAAGTEVREKTWKIVHEPGVWESKSELVGPNAGLFRLGELANPRPNSSDWTNTLYAIKHTINYTDYDEPIETARPLTSGVYDLTWRYTRSKYVLCAPELARNHSVIVTVTAPPGTVHEAFFDPVTDGVAVGADASNGVLEPASFEAGGGTSTTIDSVTWESQQVRMEFSPSAPPSGHHVDFIALDGSVALRLRVDDATLTVDGDGTALSWGVCSQPWEAGDKLMLRISESGADITGATNDAECLSSGP